jgi:hypothetical protein
MNIEPGTISFGTLRTQDLIQKFVDEVIYLDPDNEFANQLDSVISGDSLEEYWESEEAGWDLEELFDILDGFAPDEMYFGAHPDDPADFGFWYME